MKKKLNLLLIGAFILAMLVSCRSSEVHSFGFQKWGYEPVATPGDQFLKFKFKEQERLYLLHLPPAIKSEKSLPVVFVFHGGGGQAKGARDQSQFNQIADREGIVVVYPYGTGGRFIKKKFLTWNSGTCCGKAMEKQVDDVGFVSALIAKLATSLHIDQKRVYATGHSNGGSLAYRLACELSDKIAAIAPVAASPDFQNCAVGKPVPVIIFHGTADEYVPYHGGVGEKSFFSEPKKSIDYAFDYWVKRNGIKAAPVVQEKGNIIIKSSSDGHTGAEVVFYTITGGHHAWPGGTKGGWKGGPEPTKEISATEIMWEFFKRHSRD